MTGSGREHLGNGQEQFIRSFNRIQLGQKIGEALDPSLRVAGSYVIASAPYLAYERVDVFSPYRFTQKIDPSRRRSREVPLLTIFRKGIRGSDIGFGGLLQDARAMKVIKHVDGREIKPIDGRGAFQHFEVAGWMSGQPDTLRDIQRMLREGEIPQYPTTEAFEQAAYADALRRNDY